MISIDRMPSFLAFALVHKLPSSHNVLTISSKIPSLADTTTAMSAAVPKIKLNNGLEIPAIGLGMMSHTLLNFSIDRSYLGFVCEQEHGNQSQMK